MTEPSRPGLAELLQTHARTAQELLGHTTVQILPLEEIEKRSAAHEAAYRAIESWVSQRTLTEEEALAVFEAAEMLNYGFPGLDSGVAKLRQIAGLQGGEKE